MIHDQQSNFTVYNFTCSTVEDQINLQFQRHTVENKKQYTQNVSSTWMVYLSALHGKLSTLLWQEFIQEYGKHAVDGVCISVPNQIKSAA